MINRTGTPIDLLSTDHLGAFLAVLALGALLGALAVVALLSLLADEPTPAADVEPLTERMAPVPAPVDLPRREWSL